jgi:hypothetical protein
MANTIHPGVLFRREDLIIKGFVTLALEPLDNGRGWRLRFARDTGPAPESVQLPANLGLVSKFVHISGAVFTRAGDVIQVNPEARIWEALWKH